MTYLVVYRLYDKEEVAQAHLLYEHQDFDQAEKFAQGVADSKYLKKNGSHPSWITIMPTDEDEYIAVEIRDEKMHEGMIFVKLSEIQ